MSQADATLAASTSPIQAGEHRHAPTKGGLGKKTVGGAAWTLGGFGASQVIRMAGNMALAWFVSPEAFGIMALVNVTMQGLHMVSDVGIGTAIIQHKRGNDETFLRTAWTLAILRSFIIAAIGCLLALPIARLYGQPILFPLIVTASLSMILHGSMSTSLFVASRDLKVHRVILTELVMACVTTMTMVGLAAVYPLISICVQSAGSWMPAWGREHLTNPVWALLAGSIAASGVRLVLTYWAMPGIRHRLTWDGESVRELVRFGKWIMVATLLTFLTGQLDRFLLPKLLNDMALFGLFGIAMGFASLPMEVLQRLGTQVLFPVYSMLAREQRFSGEVYNRVSFIILTLGAISVAGLVAIAPGFIQTFYKTAYHDVSLLLQALGLVVWLRVVQYNSSSALLALGDTRIQASSNAIKLVAMIVLIPAGFYAGKALSTHSLAGVLGAIAGLALAELLKYALLAHAFAKGDLKRLLPDLKATIELAFACSLVVLTHILTRTLPSWLDMLLSGACVLAIYTPVALRALRMVAPHLPMKLPGPLARWQVQKGGRS